MNSVVTNHLWIAIEEQDVEGLSNALYLGADPNAKEIWGSCPLHHVAMESGNLELLTILLKAGAKVDIRDSTDWTPLHCAAWSGNEYVVRELLEAGADPTLQNDSGVTPQELAEKARYDSIASLIDSYSQEQIKEPSCI